MSKEYEKALAVISQPSDKRYDHEIHHLVPWFRSKAKLFKSLKADLICDIIRNCDYVTKKRDDVIIKQGELGECFYIVLSGKVTIYILNKDQGDGEDDEANFDNLIQYNKDGELDRSKLGYCVTSLESGAPFGDVALTSGDSIRTASIIADEHTDLLVVDRALYNRSVKEVLAKEFLEKTTFITNNPLFSVWPTRYRKQLAMALYSESFAYEDTLVRQGDTTMDMYFILSGQVEIQMDPTQHALQYTHIFKVEETDKILRNSDKSHRRSQVGSIRSYNSSYNNSSYNNSSYNNSSFKRRKSERCTRLCHLGVNESVGDVELTMDLPTYMQTAVCKETTLVLVLENKHYERLFTRRHPRTIDGMRDQIALKLASRISLLNTKDEIPFLNYLKKAIDSRNRPLVGADRGKEDITVMEAERDFLKHKGPLVDQDGPGSVFYLIRLREKTKKRVRAKRGERIDRHLALASPRLATQSAPKSLQMPVATQLGTALEESTGRGPSRDHSSSSCPGMDTTTQANVQHEEGWVDADCEGSNTGQRALTSTAYPELDDAEKYDAKLRTLEHRLKQWLEVDNPKGKPQVAHLRRLDTESQPKPGNRVVVRRRNKRPPESVFSSSSLSSSQESDKEGERSKGTDESRLAAYSILLTD